MEQYKDIDSLIGYASALHDLEICVKNLSVADMDNEYFALYNDIAKEAVIFIKALLDFNAANADNMPRAQLDEGWTPINPEWISRFVK